MIYIKQYGCVFHFMTCEKSQIKKLCTLHIHSYDVLEKANPQGQKMDEWLLGVRGEGCGKGLATAGKCRTSGGNILCLDCGGGQILHPLKRVDVTIYKLKSNV